MYVGNIKITRSKKESKNISKIKENDIIQEIYDIALVQLGLLYGDRLMNFLKRSVKFIESHQEITAAKTSKKAKKSKKED